MDNVIKSELYFEGDSLVHKTTQPTEDLILEQNKKLRNEQVINDLGKHSPEGTWGRQVASIPLVIYAKAKRDGFDLDSKDSQIASREMLRFLRTPEGQACLVRDRV